MNDKLKEFYKTKWGKVCLVLLFIAGCYAAYINYTSKNIENCLKPYQSQEYEKAYKSCSALANKGDVRAKLVVGDMYVNGYHVQKDYDAAEALFIEVTNDQSKPAAHKLAYYALGELYFRKDFPKRNMETSVKWFKLAADQGMNHAQLKYGIALFIGNGVERDVNLAKEYVLKASQNGLKKQAEQVLILINSPEADEAAKMMLEEIKAKS